MDQIKVNNFRKEYPNRDFPAYRCLDSLEIIELRKSLVAKVDGLEATCSDLDIVRAVDQAQSLVRDFCIGEFFEFESFLEDQNLIAEGTDKIWLNWYRYDDVDELDRKDFSKYFKDLWYEGADDLDIIDPQLAWIVSVGHSGIIKVLRLG
tara:strand:+ start:29 stop:478 length:450 start_codon:yes stop_codon:yes gene_type:complete